MSTSSASKDKATAGKEDAFDAELDRLLNREATGLQRELEITRILKSLKLNPYEILDIGYSATPEEVKRKYRQLSLFIHPDKTSDPRAPDAFDILKKAEAELSDKDKREELDAVIKQCRILVLKSLSLPPTTPDDHEALQDIVPSFKDRMKVKAKEMLIEEEVRRRQAIRVNLANEGNEQRQKDAEVAQKKRKAEEDARWEENRESRVDSWRSFAGNKGKKKKQKTALLG
ncbi:DnaJ-domain-containing protein [Sistotremastrum suecicum HHB10207 ss-3]|uniref:DnaJ-domain-containing protein n=1 Tax=Sistotremastrum suecicum HHB10207 ss-3 TaxID=1314776 RepID=A0A166G1T7_9AGAM|nr:DnaJ-domain-containing protein [Sistotremastrum suecicum HHB10207 ss-3]